MSWRKTSAPVRRDHASHIVAKLTRSATRARRLKARAIKKMQVAAYSPVLFGAQAFEYRGVSVAVKKVIIMLDAAII